MNEVCFAINTSMKYESTVECLDKTLFDKAN